MEKLKLFLVTTTYTVRTPVLAEDANQAESEVCMHTLQQIGDGFEVDERFQSHEITELSQLPAAWHDEPPELEIGPRTCREILEEMEADEMPAEWFEPDGT